MVKKTQSPPLGGKRPSDLMDHTDAEDIAFREPKSTKSASHNASTLSKGASLVKRIVKHSLDVKSMGWVAGAIFGIAVTAELRT